MNRQLFIITSACLLVLTVLSGCHTGKQQMAAAHHSQQPKFLNNIYMDGHNKASTTANAIKPNTRADRSKRNKPAHNEPVAADERIEVTTEPRKLKKKYAELIGVRPKEIDNYQLYQFIDNWYGTSYRLGGSDKDGIDCSGFAKMLYTSVYGVELLRTAMEQFENCKRVKHEGDAEEGDLIFFRQKSKRITHVGVYLANDYFVHASTSQGVVISSLKEEYWHKHYVSMGRIPRGS